MKLNPGDKIDCLIKNSSIVSPYSNDYDNILTFEIIAKDNNGYFIYIPHYIYINNSIKIDSLLASQLNINSKFINEYLMFIKSSLIYNVKSVVDGVHCANCKEFFYMAEPNQPNNTLICWSCKSNPYR